MEGRKDGRRAGWTKWRFRLAAVLLSLLGTGCVTEIVLRSVHAARRHPIWYPGERENGPDGGALVADAELGWKMKPKSAVTERLGLDRDVVYVADADGFRCAPAGPPSAARPARPRIVLLGCSQTWGFGLHWPETLGVQLARRLEGVAVRNLAMCGYGLDQVLIVNRRYALPLAPELVVVGVYGPGFDRALTAYGPTLEFKKPAFVLDGEAGLRRMTEEDRPGALPLYIERHSRIFNLARRVWHGWGRYAEVGQWWRINAALLAALQRDCDAAGVPVLFVRIPGSLDMPFPVLARHLEAIGADYVDPALRPPAAGDLYFRDGHLAPAGVAWIADCAAEWIRTHRPGLGGATPSGG